MRSRFSTSDAADEWSSVHASSCSTCGTDAPAGISAKASGAPAGTPRSISLGDSLGGCLSHLRDLHQIPRVHEAVDLAEEGHVLAHVTGELFELRVLLDKLLHVGHRRDRLR